MLLGAEERPTGGCLYRNAERNRHEGDGHGRQNESWANYRVTPPLSVIVMANPGSGPLPGVVAF
jgi:hypothetical protein